MDKNKMSLKDNTLYCWNCKISYLNGCHPCTGQGKSHDIMFIGEAPGRTENREKIPFIGNAGKLLRNFVEGYNLTDYSFYTNVVKCQPPDNRKPSVEEINNCHTLLCTEISLAKPKIIVLLGSTAINIFHNLNEIEKSVGDCHNYAELIGKVVAVYAYHPSYILRSKNYKLYFDLFDTVALISEKLLKWYIKDWNKIENLRKRYEK
jgi:DNA polymerase